MSYDSKQVESIFRSAGITTVEDIETDGDVVVFSTTFVSFGKLNESDELDSLTALSPDYVNNRMRASVLLNELKRMSPTRTRSSSLRDIEYQKVSFYDIRVISDEDDSPVNDLVSCKWNSKRGVGTISLANGVEFGVASENIARHYDSVEDRSAYVAYVTLDGNVNHIECSYGLTNLFRQIARLNDAITDDASHLDDSVFTSGNSIIVEKNNGTYNPPTEDEILAES